MVRRHTTALRVTLMALDFFGAAALVVLASIARYGTDWTAGWQRLGIDAWLAAGSYGAGWVVLAWLHGVYRLRARYSLRGEAAALLKATAILGLVIVTLVFALRVSDASRALIGILLVSTAVISVGVRFTLRTGLAWLRRRGRMTRLMLIAGATPAAQDFADRVERHADLGIHVIGHLAAPGDDPAAVTRPILADLDEIETVLHQRIVDEVAVCLPVSAWDLVAPITSLCAGEGKIVRIPPDGGPALAGGYSEDFDGLHLVSLVHGPDRAAGLFLKRVLDLLVASVALLALSPLLAAIALYIRLADGSPVTYRQARVGLNGRRFQLLKYRTMQPDAERRLAELEQHNEVRGQAFKLTDDPRLTRSGAFLRRTSLDELPQLWNVLRGEMSLVGPRPPLPREVEGYDVWHRRRLSMKPGMTGLWQVSSRREPDFDRWVEKDLEYIDRWSLWLDLTIILRTFPAIVSQQGR